MVDSGRPVAKAWGGKFFHMAIASPVSQASNFGHPSHTFLGEGGQSRPGPPLLPTSLKRLPVDKPLRAGGVMLPIRALLTAVAAGGVILNNCRISASKIKGL